MLKSNILQVLVDFVAGGDALIVCRFPKGKKDSIIVAVTPKVESVLGFKISWLLGQPTIVVIPMSYQDQHLEKSRALNEKRDDMGTRGYVLEALNVDGNPVDVEALIQPFDLNGELYVAAVLRPARMDGQSAF